MKLILKALRPAAPLLVVSCHPTERILFAICLPVNSRHRPATVASHDPRAHGGRCAALRHRDRSAGRGGHAQHCVVKRNGLHGAGRGSDDQSGLDPLTLLSASLFVAIYALEQRSEGGAGQLAAAEPDRR